MLSQIAGAMSLDEVLRRPEPQQRDIISDTAGGWFLAEDFKAIEDLADSARAKKLRTSSGIWVSGLVYNGIEGISQFRKVKSDEGYDKLEAIARRWIKAYPKSPTATIAYAAILQNRAWLYRGGGGYASTVSEQQFAAFHKQIEKAKKYELAHRAAASADPNWAMYFLETLTFEEGNRQEEFERTFAEAVRLFPDYYPVYFAAADYYLPKWHGDAGEVEHFARQVMTSRGGRIGKMLYARIYWYASQNQFKGGIFLVSLARWNDMREGLETIVSDYPDQWNINHYAKFACLVIDQETTRKAFDMMKGEPISKAWSSTKQYEECRHFSGRIST